MKTILWSQSAQQYCDCCHCRVSTLGLHKTTGADDVRKSLLSSDFIHRRQRRQTVGLRVSFPSITTVHLLAYMQYRWVTVLVYFDRRPYDFTHASQLISSSCLQHLTMRKLQGGLCYTNIYIFINKNRTHLAVNRPHTSSVRTKSPPRLTVINNLTSWRAAPATTWHRRS